MESLLPKSFKTDGDGNVTFSMSQVQFALVFEILNEKEKELREKERVDSIRLDEVFGMFISNYEILSESSKRNYGQQFKNLVKWLHQEDRCVDTVGGVTSELAEKYIRYVYARKKSAKFEIRTYRRIWAELFPESYANPWVHKLHLATFHPKKNMSHRPFKRRELRQILTFLDSIIEYKEREAKGLAKPREGRASFYSAYSVSFVRDLRDAIVFAITYGMRMGSCASLKWSDFKRFTHSPMFYHLPPKTARSKPIPLELPYLPQITEILERRRPENINAAYKREERLFEELSEMYGKGACVVSGTFGRLIDKLRIKDSSIGVASFHSFRTTFVSLMDEVGAPNTITDSITGHSSKEMHSLYSKPSAVVKRRWIAKAYAKMDFSYKFDEEMVKDFENDVDEEEEVLVEPT